MVVIIFYRSTRGGREGIECFSARKMKAYLLENLWTIRLDGGRLMFYEWSQLRCTGIPTSLRINGENSRSSAVDDFVTSLRKEATVQSGRGNLYPGKGDLVRPIPNYSPRSSTSLGRGCFCFCLNILYWFSKDELNENERKFRSNLLFYDS